jgi:hypothetical protein
MRSFAFVVVAVLALAGCESPVVQEQDVQAHLRDLRAFFESSRAKDGVPQEAWDKLQWQATHPVMLWRDEFEKRRKDADFNGRVGGS